MSKTKVVQAGFDLNEANLCLQELFKESDRGAVLIAAAFLDDLLINLCRAKMMSGSKVVNRILEYPGCLASVAARSDLAFALGWIGPQVYGDLKIIRRVRNEFAHSSGGRTFEDPDIQRLCDSLECLKYESRFRMKQTKDKFIFGALSLMLQLGKYVSEGTAPPLVVDPPVIPIEEYQAGAERKRLGIQV